MKKPNFITFTGIDERTDLTRADELAKRYPIEWGVLFSMTNQDARYPCSQAVQEILEIGGKKSAHICGRWSRELQGSNCPREIPLGLFNRCQINGNPAREVYFGFIADRYGVEIIKQTRSAFTGTNQFRELFDCSGGRGQMPLKRYIPKLYPGHLVGYAGGMGPDTVLDYLGMIEGDGEFWIDMEGQVRTNGWFDLGKVERVCELVYGEAVSA